jgi:hypothetical protein
MIIFTTACGLLAGCLLAAAWTAGCRQGRRDVLAVVRSLQFRDAPGERRPEGRVEGDRRELISTGCALVDDHDRQPELGGMPHVPQP